MSVVGSNPPTLSPASSWSANSRSSRLEEIKMGSVISCDTLRPGAVGRRKIMPSHAGLDSCESLINPQISRHNSGLGIMGRLGPRVVALGATRRRWLAAIKQERPDLHSAFNPWDSITDVASVRNLLRDGGLKSPPKMGLTPALIRRLVNHRSRIGGGTVAFVLRQTRGSPILDFRDLARA
jgi:hypothetical protein